MKLMQVNRLIGRLEVKDWKIHVNPCKSEISHERNPHLK